MHSLQFLCNDSLLEFSRGIYAKSEIVSRCLWYDVPYFCWITYDLLKRLVPEITNIIFKECESNCTQLDLI